MAERTGQTRFTELIGLPRGHQRLIDVPHFADRRTLPTAEQALSGMKIFLIQLNRSGVRFSHALPVSMKTDSRGGGLGLESQEMWIVQGGISQQEAILVPDPPYALRPDDYTGGMSSKISHENDFIAEQNKKGKRVADIVTITVLKKSFTDIIRVAVVEPM